MDVFLKAIPKSPGQHVKLIQIHFSASRRCRMASSWSLWLVDWKLQVMMSTFTFFCRGKGWNPFFFWLFLRWMKTLRRNPWADAFSCYLWLVVLWQILNDLVGRCICLLYLEQECMFDDFRIFEYWQFQSKVPKFWRNFGFESHSWGLFCVPRRHMVGFSGDDLMTSEWANALREATVPLAPRRRPCWTYLPLAFCWSLWLLVDHNDAMIHTQYTRSGWWHRKLSNFYV